MWRRGPAWPLVAAVGQNVFRQEEQPPWSQSFPFTCSPDAVGGLSRPPQQAVIRRLHVYVTEDPSVTRLLPNAATSVSSPL